MARTAGKASETSKDGAALAAPMRTRLSRAEEPEGFLARIGAEVFGNLYGTLRKPMQATLDAGKMCLLEIDVQGALQLKAIGEPGIYVFIAPPDFEELRKRLVARNTETPEALERRLHKAEDEYRERVKYDHVIVNDDLDQAVARVKHVLGLEPARS